MDASILPIPQRDRTASAEERSRFRGVFFDVAPAMFLGTLDQTIVAATLPAIAVGLGGFADIAWIVTAYLLAATAAAPIYGRLGDAFGRRRALIWALVLFLAGSVACGFAPTLPWLIGARGMQGLGGGGLMTLAQALIGEAVSPKERGRFQGWFGAIFALASTLGPVAGGLLSEHLGWRYTFWVNIPLGFVAAIAALRLNTSPGAGRFTPDLVGTPLFVGATLALLLALSLGPTIGWSTPIVIGLAVAALIGYGLLWPAERHSSDPLIPPDLLSLPVVWRGAICVLLFAAVLFAAIVQLPLFLQLVLGVSPSLSGLMLIPLTLAQVAISTLTGLRISTTGHPRNPMAIGLSIAALGFALVAATLGFGPLAVCAASIIFGVGLGTIMPAAQTMVQWAAGTSRLGSATAMLSFTRSIGGVMGAAIASAVLLGVMHVLAPSLATQIAAIPSSTSPDAARGHLASPEVQGAFRCVFASLSAIAAVAAAIAWSIPDIDLSAPAQKTANAKP